MRGYGSCATCAYSGCCEVPCGGACWMPDDDDDWEEGEGEEEGGEPDADDPA